MGFYITSFIDAQFYSEKFQKQENTIRLINMI